MYFYDSTHEANFEKMLKVWPQGNNDPEYRVACYVIAHPEIFKKATRNEWEFIFDDWTEQEDFSHGIRLLIDMGLHLYGPFSVLDGIATWDTRNY